MEHCLYVIISLRIFDFQSIFTVWLKYENSFYGFVIHACVVIYHNGGFLRFECHSNV